MKPKILLRIAAGCLLFFAVGHSIGHITRKDVRTPEALEVYKQMETYKFPLGPELRSYDEFYEGMSLNLTITLVTFVAVLWAMSGFNDDSLRQVQSVLWIMVLCLIAFTITSFMYFFFLPAVTSLVAGVLIVVSIFSPIKNQ